MSPRPGQSPALLFALPFLLASASSASGCRDFSLGEPEPQPRIDAVAAPFDPPGGYWRDRLVLEGSGLGADVSARFDPEGIAATVVESTPTRILLEVPDLGDPGRDKTLRLFCARAGPDAFAEYAFDYRGPGQARNNRISETRSLTAPITDIRRIYVPPAYRDDPGLEQLAAQIVFAYTSGSSALADYLLPISLRANVALSSIELERPILDSAILAVPNPSGEYPYLASVITLTEDGKMHLHAVAFEKLAEDFGWVTRFAFGSVEEGAPLDLDELVVRFVDPALQGDVAALVVAGRIGAQGFVTWRGMRPDGSPSRVDELAGELTLAPLDAVITGERVFLTGIAESKAALVRELVVPQLGTARLAPLRLASGKTLEEALGYSENDLLFPGQFAASPDDQFLAISFFEHLAGKELTLPRMALLARDAGGALHLSTSAAGGFLLSALAFARRDGQNVLYAIDQPSSTLVRLDPATLLPAAAFGLPLRDGEPSRPSCLSSTASGDRLLVGLESGDLYQFDTASETFARRTAFERHADSVLSFDLDRKPTVVVNAASGDLSPGRMVLVRPKLPTLFLGGVSLDQPVFGSGAFLRLVPGAAAAEGVPNELELFSSTVLVDGETGGFGARITVLGEDGPLTRECATARVALSVATTLHEDVGYALTVDPAVPERIELVPFSKRAEAGNDLCGALNATAPVWSAPLALATAAVGPDKRILVRVCEGTGCESSRLVYLHGETPMGEIGLANPTSSSGDRLAPLPLALDGRGCGPGFKPAAYAGLDTGVAVVQLEASDAGGACLGPSTVSGTAPAACRRRSEEDSSRAVDAFCLQVGRIVALAPSPNGRKLYVLANREAHRWLVEVEVERNTLGAVVGLSSRSEVLVGSVSDPSAGGVSVHPDGTPVYATAGSSLVYYE